VVEAVAPDGATHTAYDDCAIAIAYGSQQIFASLGLWPALAPHAGPIRGVHVSEAGRFGATRLRCTDGGVEALGYVVSARALGQVLLAAREHLPDVQWFQPAAVTALVQGPTAVRVDIDREGTPQVLRGTLVVACDGGQSVVREHLRAPTSGWDYGQRAIATNVTPERGHHGIAYERFTRGGPLALLPMIDERCAVVWTNSSRQAERLLALPDDGFLAALQSQFGARLGRLLRVGRRQSYPLRLVQVRRAVYPRVVLIGNAAHNLHPVAGQGFNLGLRDAAVLAEVILGAVRAGTDLGEPHMLRRYADLRRGDQRATVAITDTLARLFTVPLGPMAAGRGLGLVTLDLLPALKRRLVRRGMGLGGRLARLSTPVTDARSDLA